MKALIVEDELQLREQLASYLTENGYAIEQAADGEEAIYAAKEFGVDIAVVDLGLPKKDGVSVIQEWRASGYSFPIIILTARDNWQDKVAGLDAGADDYLVKPFHQEELLARLKALHRRSIGQAQSSIDFGCFSIDLSAKTVSIEGANLDLTAYEFNALEYLVSNAGKTISKAELTEHLYSQDYDRDSNVIEVFVGRLRKKIDPSGKLKPIRTVRGLGYCFDLKPVQ